MALAHLTTVELQILHRLEFLRGIHTRTPTNGTLTKDFPRQNLVLTRDPNDGQFYWAPSHRSHSMEDYSGNSEFITSVYEEEDDEDADRLVFLLTLRKRTIAALRVPRRTLDMLVPNGNFDVQSWAPIIRYISTETIIDLLKYSLLSRQDVILESVRLDADFVSRTANRSLRVGDWILQSRYFGSRTIIKNYDDRQRLPYRPF